MWSPRLSRCLIAMLVAGAACISTSLAEDQGKKTPEANAKKTLDDEKSVYRVVVKTDTTGERKVVLEKTSWDRIEPLRLYRRYEERTLALVKDPDTGKFKPVIDPETKKAKRKPRMVFDYSDIDGKFGVEPHRALKIGTVVWGEWLGDSGKRKYELTANCKTPPDCWQESSNEVNLLLAVYYEDGRIGDKEITPAKKPTSTERP